MRSRERDEKGRLRGADYVIYEQPQPREPEAATSGGQPPILDLPTLENPTLDNPTLEKPTQEKPTLENPTQLNKDILSKEQSITDLSSTDSIPFHSLNPLPFAHGEAATPPERKRTEAKSNSAVEIYREIIKDNIEYDHLIQNCKIDKDRLDEIVDLMLETVCTARKTIRIAGDDYPAELGAGQQVPVRGLWHRAAAGDSSRPGGNRSGAGNTEPLYPGRDGNRGGQRHRRGR